jgi:hypothetical protein
MPGPRHERVFILALFAAGWPSEGRKKTPSGRSEPRFFSFVGGIANPAFDSSRSNAAQIP